MQDFDLIAFDLDGTTFPRPARQEVSKRVSRAFAAAHASGAVVVASTGRPSWMLGDQLPRVDWLDWAVCANGSSIRPSLRGEAGFGPGQDFYLEGDAAVELARAMEGHGAFLSAHLQGHSILDRGGEKYLLEFSRRAKDFLAMGGVNPISLLIEEGAMQTVDSIWRTLKEDPTLSLCKLDCNFADAAACDAAMADATRLARDGAARAAERSIEITAPGRTKGSGIEWLCQSLDIDPTRVVAFGDSGNDLSMANGTFRFVAMDNAPDDIKRAADEVCPSVHEDGVAQWIEAHL